MRGLPTFWEGQQAILAIFLLQLIFYNLLELFLLMGNYQTWQEYIMKLQLKHSQQGFQLTTKALWVMDLILLVLETS